MNLGRQNVAAGRDRCGELRMSENNVEKDYGPLDRVKDASGIYGLGFERESFLGFITPFIVVGALSLIGAAVIVFWLS
jgi:hypothetical protein